MACWFLDTERSLQVRPKEAMTRLTVKVEQLGFERETWLTVVILTPMSQLSFTQRHARAARKM